MNRANVYRLLQPRVVRAELSADGQNLEISWKAAPYLVDSFGYQYKIYVIVPNAFRQQVYSGEELSCTLPLADIYERNNNTSPIDFQIVTFRDADGFESIPVQFSWPMAIL